MATKGVEQKPSETALFAALRRTIAHKEFHNEKFGPDDLAEYFLPPHFRFFLKFGRIRTNTKDKLNGFMPGLNEYMIARTVYFDKLFTAALNEKVPQIVLLGAGYDSKAYRFAKLNRGTRIFELDITPTQNRKKKCLGQAHIDIPQGVTFVSINFNEESIKAALEKAGFDGGQKTLFLWEGVSYYLTEESVNSTLEFVSKTHPESAIGFDYTISISEENIEAYYGVREFAQTMKEQHASEELMFSIKDGETEAYLNQRGLRMVEHLDNEGIEKAFLLDENERLLGQ